MKLEEVLKQEFSENDTRMYYSVYPLINAKEKIEDELEKEIYESIVKMMILRENYKKVDNTFPECISNISDDEIEKIKKTKLSSFPVVVSSRIFDILWVREKNVDYARKSVEKYLELFKETYNPEHWVVCINYIFRATVIAAQMDKKGKEYAECIKLITDKLDELDGKDNSFLSIELIELLEFQKYADTNKLLILIDKIIENAKMNNNINKVEQAYNLKLKLEKNDTNKKLIKLEWGEYYEKLADLKEEKSFSSISNKIHYLEEAIHKYNDAGEKEKSENAMKKLDISRKESNKYMTQISSGEIDVSDIVKQIEKSFEGLSFEDAIITLGKYTSIYIKEDIKKEVQKDFITSPLSLLFTTRITDEKGRTIINLYPLDDEDFENNSKKLETHMSRKLLLKQSFEGSIISSRILNNIKNNYDFKKEDISFLVKNNFIIPEGREKIFIEGIYLGLKGEYYAALHILAPQMENLFRNLAEELGGITFTLEDDNTSNIKVLSSVFDIEKLNECYSEDILFTFKSLLNERAGANIRNNIGHGIMEDNLGNKAIAQYFIAVTIKLLSLYVSEE